MIQSEQTMQCVCIAIMETKTGFEWERGNISHLTSLYENYPRLYDVTSQEYKDRDKRNAATDEIAAALGTSGKWKTLIEIID